MAGTSYENASPKKRSLLQPEAFDNNSAPYKSGLKIKGFHFFTCLNHFTISNMQGTESVMEID